MVVCKFVGVKYLVLKGGGVKLKFGCVMIYLLGLFEFKVILKYRFVLFEVLIVIIVVVLGL